MNYLSLSLLACCSTALLSADLIAIRADYHAELAKNQTTFISEHTRATDKLIRTLTTLADTVTKRGNLAEASEAWREVLRFNVDNPSAREFFTALGTLERTLEDVSDPRPLPQFGGTDMALMKKAQPVRVPATLGDEVRMGPLPAGTKLLFQYQNGMWGTDGQLPSNPDDRGAPRDTRLALIDFGANPVKVITIIPPGTKDQPYQFTLATDVVDAGLWVVPRGKRRMMGNQGSVTYKIAASKK